MDNKRLGKALDIMRLAEEAAARPGGISLVQIVETFGVTLRTAQRMSRALEIAFPMVQTRTDQARRKWWQLPDSRLLHMQGIRDSELSALEMGIRRAERDGATTEVTALTSLRNRLLATMPPTFARRAEVDAEAVLEARGHACRPGPRAQYSAHVLGVIDAALTGAIKINTEAMDRLQSLRNRLGKPLIVRSGYRSPSHNRAVGGAPASKHMLGTAFDIAMSNHDPVTFAEAARAVGFLGFGTYPRSGFMHIDLGPARTWGEPFPVRATPFVPETQPAREVLADSRTLKGGGAAGIATVSAAGVEIAQDVLAETQSAILPLVPYLDTLR